MKGKNHGKLIFEKSNYWVVLRNTLFVLGFVSAGTAVFADRVGEFVWYVYPIAFVAVLLFGLSRLKKVELSRSSLVVTYPILGKSIYVNSTSFSRLRFLIQNFTNDNSELVYDEVVLFLDGKKVVQKILREDRVAERLCRNSKLAGIDWEESTCIKKDFKQRMIIYEKRLLFQAKNLNRRSKR